MRKKEPMSSVKWSQKNQIYLQRLGFLDARTGKVRKEMNMNKFINESVTMILESSKHPLNHTCTGDELRDAFIKYAVAKKNRIIMDLEKEVVELANKRPIKRKFEEAMQIMEGDQ